MYMKMNETTNVRTRLLALSPILCSSGWIDEEHRQS